MCLAHFGGKALDLMVLGSEGEIRKAHSAQNGEFSASTPLCTVKGLSGKVWLLAGKSASAVRDDVLVVDSKGSVQVFDAEGALRKRYSLGLPVTDAAAGDIDGDGKVELAVRAGEKVLLYRLGETARKIAALRAPPGQEALAMGDISGDGKADVLIDGQVFLAPTFQRVISVPGWDKFTKPVLALMADVAGHGRADIVVQHEGPDYFGSVEADCDLYITYFKSDTD